MARTLIVGDVHGCLRELDTLLSRFERGPGDQVVFVGDLVAKGPDSKGVVARARALGAQAVRGNHDERFLAWHRAVQEGRPPPDLGAAARAACETLNDEEWAWLASLPYVLRLPEHGVLVVHAGLVPGRPLEAQEPEHLLHMRSIRPDGTVSSRVDDGVPWASRWSGPQEVVFGHDALRGLQRHAHAIGLDTGCVYGGRLTGYVLPDRALMAVPAERVWSPPGAHGEP